MIGSILRGLNENGCLILVEKVLGEDSVFNRLFIKYYYDFKKRNVYSELEIAQEREALENVLIPYKLLENRELLLKEGFYIVMYFSSGTTSAVRYCGHLPLDLPISNAVVKKAGVCKKTRSKWDFCTLHTLQKPPSI